MGNKIKHKQLKELETMTNAFSLALLSAAASAASLSPNNQAAFLGFAA